MTDRRWASIADGYLGGTADARRLLLVSVLTGAAGALFTINFVPYLAAAGLETSTIARIVAVASALAGVYGIVVAVLARRVGRRIAFLATIGLAAIGLLALGVGSGLIVLVAAVAFTAGQQGITILEPALLRERGHAKQRDGLFAAQFAIITGMGAVAAGIAAWWLASRDPTPASDLGGYRLLFASLSVALVVAVVIARPLADDRRLARRAHAIGSASSRVDLPQATRALGRLLLPWMLIAVGSGQVMPFLSYYLQERFDLDTATVNLIFAGVGLVATLSILLQPALVRRVGRIPSIVIVQGASIPMVMAIAFGPFAVVVIATGIRSALMEAGHPIYNLSVMEAVPASLRPLVSSIQMLILAFGAAIGAAWFGYVQEAMGFDAGFAIAWVTMAVLYAAAMILLPFSLRPIRLEPTPSGS